MCGYHREADNMDRTQEIITRLQAGEIDEAEAQRLLDEDFERTQRRQTRREIPIGLIIDGVIAVDENDPERELIAEQASRAVLALVNSLPRRQSQCVELYYYDGMTQEQIAERLSVGQRVVSEHLTSAKRNLATIIAADPLKQPSQWCKDERSNTGCLVTDLMRDNIRNYKRTSIPFFPFEMWQRFNAGARWTRYNEYRPIIENRLPQYLCDCFAVPPVVGCYTMKQGQRKTRATATTPRRKPR